MVEIVRYLEVGTVVDGEVIQQSQDAFWDVEDVEVNRIPRAGEFLDRTLSSSAMEAEHMLGPRFVMTQIAPSALPAIPDEICNEMLEGRFWPRMVERLTWIRYGQQKNAPSLKGSMPIQHCLDRIG